MAKQTFTWDAGVIVVDPPAGAPEGCPPAEITLGNITVTWGEDDPLPPAPDWATFRTALADNDTYLRVIAADVGRGMLLNLAVERLHALSGAVYLVGLTEVVTLWNKIVIALQTPLTQEEIDTLNTLGTTNNVSFALDAQGLLGAGQ